MSSSLSENAKSESDEEQKEMVPINRNYKLLTKLERKNPGYMMKSVYLEPKSVKDAFMLRRTAWLVQCVENYMIIKNNMDDELGIRLVSLTQNPLELLNFEFQNFSRLARSGLPKSLEGTKEPYLSRTPDFTPLTLAQLAEELGHTHIVNGNPILQTMYQRRADKYRILFGTEFNVQKDMFLNRYFTDDEERAEPGKYQHNCFAVWIGPGTGGKCREFRLSLTNLYKPKILSELADNFVIALAQLLISVASHSMCEGAQSTSTLLQSITSTNAQFLIAAALSPYQALNRFLIDNFASFQEWTGDVDPNVLTIKMGETHIMHLPDININIDRTLHTNSNVSKSCKTLETLLEEANTSISVQCELIRMLRWLSINHKLNAEYDELVSCFNCSTRKAYAVAQMMERTKNIYGTIPSLLIDLFEKAIHFKRVVNKTSAMSDHVLDNLIRPKNVPLGIRVAYLELFIKKCEGVCHSSIGTVTINGLYIRTAYRNMPEDERNIVLRYSPK